MEQRKPRNGKKPECCSMKTLTILILVTMLVQLFIMLIPVYLGTSFYVNNKEELRYSKNLHVKKLIDRANDIGDLPITTVAGGRSWSGEFSCRTMLIENIVHFDHLH